MYLQDKNVTYKIFYSILNLYSILKCIRIKCKIFRKLFFDIFILIFFMQSNKRNHII